MNQKIYKKLLEMDLSENLEKQISEVFLNGRSAAGCPTDSIDLAIWIHVNVLENYFRNHWTPDWSNYLYSNDSIVEKINSTNPGSVIDIGCGDNLFKGKIQNLIGVDPFNSKSDIEVDILEYETPDTLFDHAVVFGSINFGDESDVEPRLEKAISLVKPGGALFFRVNPGIQHENPNSQWIQFFDWSEENIFSYAKKYNCDVQNLHWERNGKAATQPRIYFELVKN